MISQLSAKYQVCAIRTADTRDGQLTTPGVYTWVVRELSIVCPSFIPAPLVLVIIVVVVAIALGASPIYNRGFKYNVL